jgi:hypothetical protein
MLSGPSCPVSMSTWCSIVKRWVPAALLWQAGVFCTLANLRGLCCAHFIGKPLIASKHEWPVSRWLAPHYAVSSGSWGWQGMRFPCWDNIASDISSACKRRSLCRLPCCIACALLHEPTLKHLNAPPNQHQCFCLHRTLQLAEADANFEECAGRTYQVGAYWVHRTAT